MNAARIAKLLSPFLAEDEYPAGIVSSSHISTYIDILLRWNARINLTAIRDPEQIVTRHFGESFFTARHLFPQQVLTGPFGPAPQRGSGVPGHVLTPTSTETSAPGSLADVGSGAGFPGIPIKLWAPEISLTLIESNHRKATFLREIARALTLTDINIRNARAETLPRATFDVVTMRAVESFEKILPAAAALLRPGGRLALLLGSAQVPQAQSILPNYKFTDPLPIPLSRARVLLISMPHMILPESRS